MPVAVCEVFGAGALVRDGAVGRCQVDGYDEIAGGIGFRKTKGDRVRFKVMHKIYDFEKRFGYPMCVGCGRCDDICPEYISYSNLINRLAKEEIEQ